MPETQEPRLAPLELEAMDPATREVAVRAGAGEGRPDGIFRTLAHHPDLLRRWMVFGAHILHKSSLPPRLTELAILRIGAIRRCRYEFAQHTRLGLERGLTTEEIGRLVGTDPAADPHWSEVERLILRAVDELHDPGRISDEIWSGLSGHLDEKQILDLIFTVGQYNLVSVMLNSVGVPLDEGLPELPRGW